MKRIFILILAFFASSLHASHFQQNKAVTSIQVLMIYTVQKPTDFQLSVQIPLQTSVNLTDIATHNIDSEQANDLYNSNNLANYDVEPLNKPLRYSSVTSPQSLLNISAKNPQQVMF